MVDYKKRLEKALKDIAVMAASEKPTLLKRIKKMADAQLENLKGIENKQV